MQEPSLTIEVVGKGGIVPVGDFVSLVGDTLSALREIDRHLSTRKEATVSWVISKVSMDSPLRLTMSAACPGRLRPAVGAVIGAYMAALKGMEAGGEAIPQCVTHEALVHMARAVGRVGDSVERVTYTADGRSVTPTRSAAEHMAQVVGGSVERRATVEGRLEMLSIHGGYTFNVYEPISGRRVACSFPGEMLDQAREAFSQRVRVSGTARFTRDGVPLSMRVERMERLREQHELPQASDLEGINITDGMDPTEYVGMLRDAE